MDDDCESIITSQRYDAIARILTDCFTRKARKSDLTLSDRVDRIVTNRWLALPIFILIMYIIYTIAMGSTAVSIGTMGTDWVNDVLLENGFQMAWKTCSSGCMSIQCWLL